MKDASDYIVRGILIGGSLGFLLGLSGLLGISLGKAAAWGMVAGFLAGLTMAKKRGGRRS